jgi:hypothetical protein
MPEKETAPKTEAPKDETKIDEKTYSSFKGMLNRFIAERETEEKETPNRTEESKDKPRPSILSTLFGGE